MGHRRNSTITIRPVLPDDAGPIAAIYNYYVRDTIVSLEEQAVSVAQMRERITHGLAQYPWLALEHDAQLLGYAYASQWKSRVGYRYCAETTIYLEQGHTGHGYGARLYAALLDELQRRGLHCALGGIGLPNAASIALHERLGFRKVGELKQVGWKMGRWIDVGYWQLVLSASAPK